MCNQCIEGARHHDTRAHELEAKEREYEHKHHKVPRMKHIPSPQVTEPRGHEFTVFTQPRGVGGEGKRVQEEEKAFVY